MRPAACPPRGLPTLRRTELARLTGLRGRERVTAHRTPRGFFPRAATRLPELGKLLFKLLDLPTSFEQRMRCGSELARLPVAAELQLARGAEEANDEVLTLVSIHDGSSSSSPVVAAARSTQSSSHSSEPQ